jgi:acyl carrier protein
MASPETLARVKKVVAESLRLDGNGALDDHMALAGGEHDLDSLDILLVITRIEKEFGIKIADRSVGRRAFADITTLADFVETQRNGAP